MTTKIELDEELPALGALEPGSADWWKEQMRSALAIVYAAQGHKFPNKLANQDIRIRERLARKG